MNRSLIRLVAGLAAALPLAAMSAPDDTQQLLFRRAMEARQKLVSAQATSGRERQRLIMEHLIAMREVVARMRTASPAESLTSQQLREWIDEHLRLMDLVAGQMMDEHHLMLQGMSR